jgi:hypothetical protein
VLVQEIQHEAVAAGPLGRLDDDRHEARFARSDVCGKRTAEPSAATTLACHHR